MINSNEHIQTEIIWRIDKHWVRGLKGRRHHMNTILSLCTTEAPKTCLPHAKQTSPMRNKDLLCFTGSGWDSLIWLQPCGHPLQHSTTCVGHCFRFFPIPWSLVPGVAWQVFWCTKPTAPIAQGWGGAMAIYYNTTTLPKCPHIQSPAEITHTVSA